ncbi:MAG: ankyrin repeat domain-containing protein [Syntrophobacteraceae bacterium]
MVQNIGRISCVKAGFWGMNNGETALMIASQEGRQNVVQLLLADGAEVNTKMNDGETALSRASHKEIKELLIRAGAK